MTNDEVMRKALHRAFSLGQTYWHQADSESYAANKRADVTQAKFNTLVEETLAHLSARPEPQAAVSEEREAFEAWARDLHWRLDSQGTRYISKDTEAGWHGWRARAVLAASRQVPVGITLTMEQAQWVFEALDIGLGAAAQEAAEYHEAMKGYRPHRHKALDDDAAKVSSALTVLGQLIEDASPLPVGEPRQEEGERSGVQACQTEQDCNGMPWCRINGKCQRTVHLPADGVPEVHARLAQAKRLHGLGPFVNAVLAECPDAECRTCAEIVCPHHDLLHFHHDGCPSCEQATPGVAPSHGIDTSPEALASAWADLPDALKAHPGVKRLYRIATAGVDLPVGGK